MSGIETLINDEKLPGGSWLGERKSQVTNLLAIVVICIGYVLPEYGNIITTMGYFALSGAVTNWLAVHMLFEKVPFLYGSGVIPCRFNEFKEGIKKLIMLQFFSEENVKKFIDDTKYSDQVKSKIDLIDPSLIYKGLMQTIMGSSFGGMLTMMGGEEALSPLREPMINKIQEIINDVYKQMISKSESTDHLFSEKIADIVDERLKELTPNMVKRIIQDMIQRHLGWLVVWGGVFGGIIGGVVAIIGN